MNSIILVAVAFVAVVAAAPVEPEPVQIVRSEFEKQPDGSYIFSFESADGITRQETGEVKEILDEEKKAHTVVVVRGTYSYPNADGKVETINYIADETGYHAEGGSLPKPARR